MHTVTCTIMEGSGLEDRKGNNRGDNWEIAEELYLVELIRKHKDDLENKDNSAPSNRKDRAWEQVELDFQARFGNKRDHKSMVNKWSRLKGKAKKDYRIHRQLQQKTGGGPAPKEISELTVIIKEITPTTFLQIENEFDDDNVIARDNEAVSVMTFLAGGARGKRQTISFN